MQITHETARKLIQFNRDQSLDPQDKSRLLSHLADCGECRAYANEIHEVETLLLPVMKRLWDMQPSPLSMDILIRSKSSNWQTNLLLVTRNVLISFVFVALAL